MIINTKFIAVLFTVLFVLTQMPSYSQARVNRKNATFSGGKQSGDLKFYYLNQDGVWKEKDNYCWNEHIASLVIADVEYNEVKYKLLIKYEGVNSGGGAWYCIFKNVEDFDLKVEMLKNKSQDKIEFSAQFGWELYGGNSSDNFLITDDFLKEVTNTIIKNQSNIKNYVILVCQYQKIDNEEIVRFYLPCMYTTTFDRSLSSCYFEKNYSDFMKLINTKKSVSSASNFDLSTKEKIKSHLESYLFKMDTNDGAIVLNFQETQFVKTEMSNSEVESYISLIKNKGAKKEVSQPKDKFTYEINKLMSEKIVIDIYQIVDQKLVLQYSLELHNDGDIYSGSDHYKRIGY